MQTTYAHSETLRHTYIRVHLIPYFGNNAYQSDIFFNFVSLEETKKSDEKKNGSDG